MKRYDKIKKGKAGQSGNPATRVLGTVTSQGTGNRKGPRVGLRPGVREGLLDRGCAGQGAVSWAGPGFFKGGGGASSCSLSLEKHDRCTGQIRIGGVRSSKKIAKP